MSKTDLICFQDLWSIAVGQSALQDSKLIEEALLDSVDSLKLGLDYFKEYDENTISRLKKMEDVNEDLYKFLSRSSKTMNVDGNQLLDLYRTFSTSYFRGSQSKLKQMLAEEKSSYILLSEFANYYFIERLYLLRTLGQIFGFFQDENHVYKELYGNIMQKLVDVIVVLEKQFENSMNSKPPRSKTIGIDKMPGAEMSTRIALQRVKEQCEILELIFLYYAHFGMSSEKLCFLANLFKESDFGADHPYAEYIDSHLLTPLTTCMNGLQQIIMIEGFDMELLQDKEEHNLFKNKKDFEELNEIILSIVDQQELSPLVIAWATIRYLLLDGHGGLTTHKMGEKAISYRAWQHMLNFFSHYPFNTNSNVTMAGRKVIRDVLMRVTSSFHEETLGDYADLISLAVLVLQDAPDSGINNSGISALLFSSAGFFPLYIDPMLSLLASMVKTKEDALQVHAFMANLPMFSEYIATCTRDEVESIEDASMWRLLASKPIRTAGGLHTIHLPVGTIGNLVDSQYGAMVQWQQNVNGWQVLQAELKNMLEYQGPSSNLELLGYIQKTELIYELVEKILLSSRNFSFEDTSYMAVSESMEVFVNKFHRIIHRVSQSPNPPTKLIMHCLKCANAWLKIKPESNAPIVFENLWQIHFLPLNEHIGFSTAVLERGNQPGLYGMILLKTERANGCFFVTVATIELLTSFLQYSLRHDPEMVSNVSDAVEFILTDVFSSYQQWQRMHAQSWDNIGLRSLEMCHLILSSYDKEQASSEPVKNLQRRVVEILSCSSVAKVVLKLSCVDVVTLHSVMASEPSSLIVTRLSDTIKLGFSLLNNLLRIEASLISRTELEERSYLHRVLATPSVDDCNLVSVVAGYIYHRHNIALPRLSVALLRRISLVAPMSLFACLGPDVAATRDVLLFRLESRSEDISLKVGILEFFVVTVQTQPGLLELFLDLVLVDKSKPEQGLTLGDSSCLKLVLNMIAPDNQGTYALPPRLHCACVKFLNALWVDKRHSAIQALRSSYTNQGLGFWSSVMYPLFSENTPKDIAKSELLETCAHIFNIIAHDMFFTRNSDDADEALRKVLDEFEDKNRHEHWSKVLLCATKTLSSSPKFDRRRHQMFTSAWKSFIITSKITDVNLINYIIDDVCSALIFLIEDVDLCPDVIVTLELISSLLLTIVYKQTKCNTSTAILLELQSYLPKIVFCIESIYDSPKLTRTFTHLQSTAIMLVEWTTIHEGVRADEQSTTSLTEVTCKLLNLQLREVDPKALGNTNTELYLLLIRSLEVFYEADEYQINNSWLTIVSRESTISLLGSVVVKCITPCRDDAIRISVAIMRLFSGISLNAESARKINDSGVFPQLCLSLTNLYKPDAQKQWLEVYHLSLVLMRRMIASLSHDFIDNTLDFIGVHYERITACLSAIRWNPSLNPLQEAVLSTAFLATVSRDFTHQWRFKLPRAYQESLRHILATTHLCVTMLLYPRLIRKQAKLREKKDLSPKSSSSLRFVASLRSMSKSQEDEAGDSEMNQLQDRLYYVLANCLEFLANLSPNLCQIMLDQEIDAGKIVNLLHSFKERAPYAVTLREECERLLASQRARFSSPTLEQEPTASFGVIISAANIALQAMHKLDSTDGKMSTMHSALSVLADSALVVVMSQCLLLLKQPNISNRQKQILKRELSDELNSCVRSANRHLRHSSSSFSPHSSPIQLPPSQTSINRSFSISNPKGILELTTAFIKQIST